MATVLGLSFFYHDSAAALVRDGQIVAAGAEERFCRRKHTNEFPKQAIEYCLEAADLRSINEVDAIVFYEKPAIKLQRIVETLVASWPKGLSAFTQKLPSFLTSKFNVYREIERQLPGYKGQILFTEHHLSHAASAFYCSPYEEAAILTLDGVGEWETTTIGRGDADGIELDRCLHFPHSIGLLYSALTGYLGFHVNDGEWKVMGLAPYGEPRYIEQFRKLVSTRPDGSFRLNMEYFEHHRFGERMTNDVRWEELFGIPPRESTQDFDQEHKDLARSGQAVVEELILSLAREAKRSSNSPNLVIAGGVGLNCVANFGIEKEGIFDNVWIQPAAGDDGGALGAALLVSQELFKDRRTPEMTDAYLGPQFSDDEINAFLTSSGVPFSKYDDDELIEQVAGHIASGKVVGWFQGRMEFGPRALGARSILADATNPEMKSIINRKVKYREFFRPFAPAVLAEKAHEYFQIEPGASMPFMLKVPDVRPEMAPRLPAITHEDGTARVQTVTAENHPRYYALIQRVGEKTGIPVVLNTSFNVRGEPVVCTPKDALLCFFNSGIDVLVLGNHVISDKSQVEVDTEAGYEKSDALEAQIGKERADAKGATSMASRYALDAAAAEVPVAPSTVEEGSFVSNQKETAAKVLNFYRELPFNYYGSGVDTALELLRSNRVKAYPTAHSFLSSRSGLRVIDVGCGAGWFANSCAHYYESTVVGLDMNPIALQQARSVSRLMPGGEHTEFIACGIEAYEPESGFDLVNSLGVLHHTPDCHGMIRRILEWVAPGGYLQLGLYHLYGRRPFLSHFADMQKAGAKDDELYREFKRLNPSITDETHLISWFRDQVFHPHETQHTYEEIEALLRQEGFVVQATSINGFKSMPSRDTLIEMEKGYEQKSTRSLQRDGRYVPGFFSVWAQRSNEGVD